jgi:FAD/FMN-containing dehydrogenase
MTSPSGTDSLLTALRVATGAARVLTGPVIAEYATDVYRARSMPLAVVRPESVEQLQCVVRIAAAANVAIYTRGGGASYTDAYLPTRSESVLIDMRGLDQVVEINQTDGYVTVEAGITWTALKAALDPLGLRTPFFGPFSGYAATVGGSVSQHSVSHGSAAYGVSAQSVISLDVVLASGELLRTGSAGCGGAPFSRWYGPDLAGLFTGDCGVFGIKARITLPLRRRRVAWQGISFAFSEFGQLAGALRTVAAEGLDDEHFAMDLALARGQIRRQARISKFSTARDLVSSASSPWRGLKQLVRSALRGSREIADAPYTAHYVVEGLESTDLRIRAQYLRSLLRQAGGREITNSVAAVVRARPFGPLYNTLGPDGERWVPVHGYIPHSLVPEFHGAATDFLRVRQPQMQRLGIWCGGMFMALDTSSFLYELAFYWPGAPTDYHRHTLPPGYLASLPKYPNVPETSAFMDQLKHELVALYTRYHAVHFQLGKTYPYGTVLAEPATGLVQGIKQALDPLGLMNPGALEL